MVKPAGDFNGDGLADVLIPLPTATVDGEAQAGKVVLMFGKAGLVGDFSIDDVNSELGTQIPGMVFTGEAAGDNFGSRVCTIYDVNQDGLDDILIAAPQADAVGKPDCGKVYLIYGRRNIIKTNDKKLDFVDYDGNGKADGAWSAEMIGTDVIFGAIFVGEAENDRLQAISPAGDVNGDGIGDFLLGAPFADVFTIDGKNPFDNVLDPPIGDNCGKAYLILGRPIAATGGP
jgi:hypothetical protein